MELQIFLLADFANVDAAHKLNIIGVFRNINVRELPTIHPSMHIVAKIAAALGEFGKKRTFQILFFDEEVNELGKIEGDFTFPQPRDGRQSEHNIVIGLRDIPFEKEGRYEFRLIVSDNLLGIIPLEVRLLRQQTTPDAPQE